MGLVKLAMIATIWGILFLGIAVVNAQLELNYSNSNLVDTIHTETSAGRALTIGPFAATIGPPKYTEKLTREKEVIFSDRNLEDAIKAEIIQEAVREAGLTHPIVISPRNFEGAVYIADLERLKSLAPMGQFIKDLSGLEYCANLTQLWPIDNLITDISPISGLTNLDDLDLSGNQITDVSPLSKLTNLRWLYLSGNQIADVSPLSGLTKLENEGDIKAYEDAIRRNPKNFTASYNKGVALYNQGNYDEAIQAFDEAIKTGSNITGHVVGSGGAYSTLNVVGLNFAWYNKGLALYVQSKYDEAIQAYNKSIELNPQYADAWNSKGIALKLLGRTAEADAAFAKAKELGYNGPT